MRDVHRWILEFNKVIEVTGIEMTSSADIFDIEFDLYRAFNATYWRRISQVGENESIPVETCED